jgi:hypothetical protein
MTGKMQHFLALGEEFARPDTRSQCATARQACQKCQSVADLRWKRGYLANVE